MKALLPVPKVQQVKKTAYAAGETPVAAILEKENVPHTSEKERSEQDKTGG